MKFITFAMLLLSLSLTASAQNKGEDTDISIRREYLPVLCGDGGKIINFSMEEYGEKPAMTWIDKEYGRYVVMVNAQNKTMSLLLFVGDSDKIICVISGGEGVIMNRDATIDPKNTL